MYCNDCGFIILPDESYLVCKKDSSLTYHNQCIIRICNNNNQEDHKA